MASKMRLFPSNWRASATTWQANAQHSNEWPSCWRRNQPVPRQDCVQLSHGVFARFARAIATIQERYFSMSGMEDSVFVGCERSIPRRRCEGIRKICAQVAGAYTREFGSGLSRYQRVAKWQLAFERAYYLTPLVTAFGSQFIPSGRHRRSFRSQRLLLSRSMCARPATDSIMSNLDRDFRGIENPCELDAGLDVQLWALELISIRR